MRRWLPWLALVSIAAALAAALLVLEGPGTARDRRIDQWRAFALSALADEVAGYRAGHDAWPDRAFLDAAIAREGADALAGADWSFEPADGQALLCLMLLAGDATLPRHLHATRPVRGVGIAAEDAGRGRLCYRITDPGGAGGSQ
ncbi:hypothetical protein M1105_17860 [Limibaculum sp. FT325]|uniref:hypothetical protein n=1 Tax=Thermohalobaculum sediminis TaxID=2939436 RepID=UPI0020BD9F6D|nr:hypothetical protein [Limibaculum sediminis]MCL5778846.1 hypothetical protein [Limibaculum sediminis]